jgi:hypothetical protein
MSTYIIETRTPATDEREAGPWHSDGMGDEPVLAKSEEEARDAIASLRNLGPDWAAAEYRYRELDAREMLRMAAAKGGVYAVLAETLGRALDDLDEADRREADRLRRSS